MADNWISMAEECITTTVDYNIYVWQTTIYIWRRRFYSNGVVLCIYSRGLYTYVGGLYSYGGGLDTYSGGFLQILQRILNL